MSRTPGSPKTGGRKAGTQNKRSREAAEVFNGQNFDAIVTTIELIRELIAEGNIDAACRYTLQLARFQYPQLKSIEVQSTGGGINLVWNTGIPERSSPSPVADVADTIKEPSPALMAAQKLLDDMESGDGS